MTRATRGSQQSGTVRVVAGFSPHKSPAARPPPPFYSSKAMAPPRTRPLSSGLWTQSRTDRDRDRPCACFGELSIAHKRPSSAVSGRSRPRPHVDVHGAQGRCCSSVARSKAVEDSASCRSPGLPAAPWSSLEEESKRRSITACRRHEIDEPRATPHTDATAARGYGRSAGIHCISSASAR